MTRGARDGDSNVSKPLIVLASDVVGLETVRFLLDHDYTVIAVATDPANRGGQNAEIEATVVRSNRGVQLVAASVLGDPGFLSEMEARTPTLGILAWWPTILRGPILKVPTMGWLNFHPSLLPFNRGKHPNFWCLTNETPCGVSLHFIDAGVDSGPVVAQATIDVGWEDTGETIYVRCRDRIVQLFKESIVEILSGAGAAIPQDPRQGQFHAASALEDAALIDLDESTTARQVLNVVRAKMFDPYPAARFQDGERTFEVRVSISEVPPGG